MNEMRKSGEKSRLRELFSFIIWCRFLSFNRLFILPSHFVWFGSVLVTSFVPLRSDDDRREEEQRSGTEGGER